MRRSCGDVRHGTATLSAALEVATGTVTDACYPATGISSSCGSSARSPRPTRVRGCTSWSDNYATHKHPTVRAWLDKHPRITLHFTPTSASWLNLVEAFFAIITRQATHRGTFASVPDLIAAIDTFINADNERCQSFVWTKTTDEIVDHCIPPKTLTPVHRSVG